MYIKDGSQNDYGSENKNVYAWGWLGDKVESSEWKDEDLKKEITEKLKKIAFANYEFPDDWHKVDCTRGFHVCEMYHEALGNASIKISYNGKIFVCPSSVYHYIEKHDYKPDDLVIEAVRDGYYCKDSDFNPPWEFEGDWDKEREKKMQETLVKGLLRSDPKCLKNN